MLLSELCNTYEINALIRASPLTLGYIVVCSFVHVNKIIPEVICKLPTSSNGGNSTDYVYVKKLAVTSIISVGLKLFSVKVCLF